MRKAFLSMILWILVLLIVCSCSGGQTQYDITPFLDSLKAMDFETMYALTEPSVDIDQDAFVKKYEAIFSGLGITEVVIDQMSGPDGNGVFTYTATYRTKEYGDFTNNYTLKAASIEEKTVVLWDYSLIFPDMDEGYSVRVSTLKASRGEIFAADGTLLAQNTYADTVFLDTSQVENIAEAASAAAPVVGMTEAEITEKYQNAVDNETRIVVLKAFFPDELTDQQKQSILAVPGLGIDDEQYTPLRSYPLGAAAAHVVGYTGYGDEEGTEKIGVSGLEAAFEDALCGRDGAIIYIEDKWGKNIRTLYEVPCEQGKDLRLTIKPDLQQKAFDALGTYLKEGQSGVAIVMDASSGSVEAMAQYPSFDDNLFNFPVSSEEWAVLTADDNTLYPLATQGQYPPGSVIKPFIAAVALDNAAITPETEFTGEIIENKWLPDEDGWIWAPITRIENSGTPLKLYNALTKSDNIYFAYAALQLGEEKLLDYLDRIGMEEAVLFDLPVKEANAVNSTTSMYRGLLADMGYGQGEELITPIQMAAMYTAFANGTGNMYQPFLVKEICQTQGLDYQVLNETSPAIWVENAVSGQSLDILAPILQDVINHGTGYRAKISGVAMAGKTGTAEIGNDKSREISWFAGYWLDGYYDRLVVVMVDVPAEEGPVKFNIAKELLNP